MAAKRTDQRSSTYLHFQGSTHFRQRIVCATLSGRSIIIKNIRSDDEEPGLHESEASFLRLIEKLTNGCKIEINETGTSLKYIPGFIVGGDVDHDCGTSKSIGWFLEAIIPFAPFSKQPLKLTFEGITNDHLDNSIDILRTVTLPLLKHFGLDEGIELKIKKRGAPPNGGGQVHFSCPVVRQLRSINLTEVGLIKRIRGIAYSTRVSPQTSNRMVDSSREIFNKLIPDVYIYTDHYSGKESGLSPGFGLSLVAESTTGVLIGVENAASGGCLPEDLAKQTSYLLCEEIKKGGCVDSSHQSLAFLLMTLSPEQVSKIRVGKLSSYSIQYLRHLRDFFGITFKIKADMENGGVLLTCLGVGYKNISKKVT